MKRSTLLGWIGLGVLVGWPAVVLIFHPKVPSHLKLTLLVGGLWFWAWLVRSWREAERALQRESSKKRLEAQERETAERKAANEADQRQKRYNRDLIAGMLLNRRSK